ncbi:3-oxoacyl-ACP synthase III family protein [Spirosoma utsteinense]|uniref:Beta-ketoacyl-[acyl-carrier-protein] synthase III n=1 Tax=Spirosoma utsteinense TaxID=2585773 RepID=A0ABR6W9V2_9BACT|nr:beta-ketoacyl-ACP synthase III [Spirosoma utsteinense]MBC3786060.1 3-oxoacyl-[acyl-carrier-protein] synthase-3 [Spirosoma utsteinense]MBC3793353.1 3-oxoacyl-[acyl-carrier-protein] synthase-3 [Spirosoma utsteinense]
MTSTYSKIAGLGFYVPDNVVTNDDLTQYMDTNDAWIQERTGIKQRRYFTYGKDTNASMATAASRMALERAGIEAAAVDLIVYATITPDYYFPGSAFLMQRELGLEGIAVIDIRQQCSGFVYALSIADQFIKSGMYKTALVVGSEIQSSLLNKSTEGRGVAVIFGDGAGAAVIQATTNPDHRILSTHLHADGRYAEDLYVKDPGSSRDGRWITEATVAEGNYNVTMNGSAVFKHAVVRFAEVINESLAANGLQPEDLSLLVPHQANIRISNYVQQQMKLPEEKVFNNIQLYGNTTAASIPIALTEAFEQGRIKSGDLVCLAAFGSGFTWASALIRW